MSKLEIRFDQLAEIIAVAMLIATTNSEPLEDEYRERFSQLLREVNVDPREMMSAIPRSL